jgi:hypothetical protein
MVILSGVVVGMYEQDLGEFVQSMVDDTTSIATKNQSERARSVVIEKHDIVLRDLRRSLDGQRYGAQFQWIYCVW